MKNATRMTTQMRNSHNGTAVAGGDGAGPGAELRVAGKPVVDKGAGSTPLGCCFAPTGTEPFGVSMQDLRLWWLACSGAGSILRDFTLSGS